MRASIQAELVIGEALTRLAAARGGTVDAVQSDVYLEDLADLSPEIVSRACELLRREPRAEFESALPDVGTIRQMCVLVADEDAREAKRQRLLPAPSDNDPRTWRHCNACDDSGWEEFFCAGDASRPTLKHEQRLSARDCRRPSAHLPHTYVHRCDCLERNPVIARQREEQARYVEKRTAKVRSR